MKKLIILCLFVLSFSANAFFKSNARITVTPLASTATVINYWGAPVVCSGQVFGRTIYGNVFNAWMNNVIVWPGSQAYITAHTNHYDRFVNAWSNIKCRWY